MGDFKINEKTVFTQSGGGEPAMGSTITGIPAAGVTGVLPVGVTGGSGLTALGTVATGNLSNSAIVYPAGHVIQDKVLIRGLPASVTAITTGNDTFVSTVIAGSFTTVKGSGDSYLVFDWFCGMGHISGAGGAWGTSTMTLKTSDTTTYDENDDILSSASETAAYRNRYGVGGSGVYMPQFHRYIFHAGDAQYPSSLTSYTAGQTLYARMYIAEPSGASFYLVHASTHYNFKVQEIMR